MITVGEKAERSLRMVREAPVMAFDTETSGVDWKRNRPVGYVFSAEGESYYIPIRHGGAGNLLDPECGPLTAPDGPMVLHRFERELARAFEDRRRFGHLTVGHNMKFDVHMAANAGILLGRNLECTQINEALLDEFARSYSLDVCAKRHGVTAKLGDALYTRIEQEIPGKTGRAAMENFWRMPGNDPLVTEYAEGDGITTLELWAKQRAAMQGTPLSEVHRIESRLIWTVFRMERRGIKVDLDRLEWLVEELERRLDAAKQALPPGFNTRSTTQVRELMEKEGATDWPTTPKGNPSFPEKWLKGYAAGRAIIEVRKISNMLNSFVIPLRDVHLFKGRVHANLNQLKADDFGTISGRFSCNSPNLQQVPKRDRVLGPLFRSVFVPDEGMRFYEADYSQCEPRLFAHYSKEPALLEGYNATPYRDMHAVVAEMLNVERDPTAKRMNMGILTGMQAQTFAQHMDWDIAYATEMFEKWFAAFPGIRDFQNQARNVMRSRGYVRTILGRICRLDHPRFAYRAVSRIIQGGNADILKYKLLEADLKLEQGGDEAHLLMTVHDSFDFQVPDTPAGEQLAQELLRDMTEVQTEPFNLRVPFVMDVGSGRNWAEATYGPQED